MNCLDHFDGDLLFRDNKHLKNACILFEKLNTKSLEELRELQDFNNIPVFLFLTSAVMKEKDLNNLSIESLYSANINRYNHKDFDISQTSKIANEFLNRKFNLDGYEKLSEEYQLIVKNAFDIYMSCLEIYESKLIRMFEKMEAYTKDVNKPNGREDGGINGTS